MAEELHYVIEIKNSTDEQEESVQTTASTENGEGDVVKKTDSSGVSKKDVKTGIKLIAAVGFAKSVTDRYINHGINMVGLQSGHMELQDKLQFQYGIAKRGASIVSSIVGGAMVGGGIGAVVGATMSATNMLIDYSIKLSELQAKREVETMTMALNSIRMGTLQDRTNRSI